MVPILGPDGRRRVTGASLLLLGVVAFLSLLFPNGFVTAGLSSGMLRLAGWGAMAVPVGLLWAGATRLRFGGAFGLSASPPQVAGAAIMLLSFLGMLHLLPVGKLEMPERAAAGMGGGYLGLAVSTLTAQSLGGWGASLVLVVAMVAGALLWARLTPRQALAKAGQAGHLLDAWQAGRRRRVVINAAREPARVKEPPVPATAHPAPRPASAELPAQEIKEPVARRSKDWSLPPIDIFEDVPEAELSQVDVRQRIKVIEETLKSFGIEAQVVEVNQGPAVTQFGVEPGVGVKVARIMALGNDLALRLAAAPLRLEAPVPGKHVVGIEVPNSSVSVVSIRQLLESPSYKKHRARLRLALGRDVSGAPIVADLAKMPHLLIAGATGSGKSVCVNSFIASMLYQCTPDDLRLLMIDPKMVELLPFNGVPHLLTPVVTEMDKVVPSLKWVTKEMERRYRLFAARGSRNIEAYNRAATGKGGDLPLPYIVVIIDELADLMMTAPDEVEKILCRLAQLARATGIHLVVATQRPSVDVVTGLIKANFPTRVAFAVTSQIDSRVILDQVGAEKLLGRGDMLYMPTDAVKPMRLQGTYVSDGEILELVDYWKQAKPAVVEEETGGAVVFEPVDEEDSDDLYEQAVEIVSQHSRVSTSLLQRRLRIGYNRAARIMELLEEEGLVGPAEGGKSREVLSRSGRDGEGEPEE